MPFLSNYLMKIFFFSLLLFLYSVAVWGTDKKLEQITPLISGFEDEKIWWGYLSVPESRNDTNSRYIQIATAIIKNASGNSNAEAIVYIPGGPGGSGILSLRFWLNHPLHNTHDIVLVDLRGTGFSKPRLCKNLGNNLFNILAQNQTSNRDEQEKVKAVTDCKNMLIAEGFDLKAYNSSSIAQDLHELKNRVGYRKWTVFGISYGTFMAKVYANLYPNDISSIILDSPISNITTYYNYNTTGYVRSLFKTFEECLQDSLCNKEYPNLKEKYFETIKNLRKFPITVKAQELKSGEFTFNEQDFQITLHQSLYKKKLIEIVPLLIYQFNQRNQDALSNLVTAFSGAFNIDYGFYYGVSCFETLPSNDLSQFERDASQYPYIRSGISFYKSDYTVCKSWNINDNSDVENIMDFSRLYASEIPVLIFSGDFDPITPPANGEQLSKLFKSSVWVLASNSGHGPSFSPSGKDVVASFLQGSNGKIRHLFDSASLEFVTSIKMNKGVSNFALSLTNFDIIFFGPFIIAVIILIFSSFFFLYKLFRNHKRNYIVSILFYISIIAVSFFLIGNFVKLTLIIQDVAKNNPYILAFGLPKEYSYVLTGFEVASPMFILVIILFLYGLRKIKDQLTISLVVFSHLLIIIYLIHWDLISFGWVYDNFVMISL